MKVKIPRIVRCIGGHSFYTKYLCLCCYHLVDHGPTIDDDTEGLICPNCNAPAIKEVEAIGDDDANS